MMLAQSNQAHVSLNLNYFKLVQTHENLDLGLDLNIGPLSSNK